jgi:hypothetical protein
MPEVFKIGFSEGAFVVAGAGELATPGVTPLAAASRFFGASLLDNLRKAMGSRLITDPAVSKGTWPARYETLENLARAGAEAWYPELRFSTRPGDAVQKFIPEPAGFRLEPIDYGFGVERFHQLKVRRLKTQANHELRLNHVVFPAALFALVADKLKAGPPPSQPYIAIRSRTGPLAGRIPPCPASARSRSITSWTAPGCSAGALDRPTIECVPKPPSALRAARRIPGRTQP